MPDRSGRRASLVLAGAIVACAVIVLVGLIVSGLNDENPGAWTGRKFGLAMVGLALLVGGVMVKYARPGGTHYWGMIGALTLAALLTGAYSYKPKEPQAGKRAEKIPLLVEDWVGRPIVEDDETREKTERILGTTDMIMRAYVRGSDVVHLAVIFAMGSRKVAHPPEQCYAADGFEIEDYAEDSFTTEGGRTVSGMRLIIIRGEDEQAVLYWYKAGKYSTHSFLLQQVYVILSNLLMRGGTRVALIRLSTPITGLHEKADAMARLKDFARDIFPEIEEKLK